VRLRTAVRVAPLIEVERAREELRRLIGTTARR
jgi:hypothetical protein